MTLKKLNRSAQAILEYFILTTIVLAAVLVFITSKPFQDIKSSCESKFKSAVQEILR